VLATPGRSRGVRRRWRAPASANLHRDRAVHRCEGGDRAGGADEGVRARARRAL